MVKEVEAAELRKLLGIKGLKKNIRISESQKTAINGLREAEKCRIIHTESLRHFPCSDWMSIMDTSLLVDKISQ